MPVPITSFFTSGCFLVILRSHLKVYAFLNGVGIKEKEINKKRNSKIINFFIYVLKSLFKYLKKE